MVITWLVRNKSQDPLNIKINGSSYCVTNNLVGVVFSTTCLIKVEGSVVVKPPKMTHCYVTQYGIVDANGTDCLVEFIIEGKV